MPLKQRTQRKNSNKLLVLLLITLILLCVGIFMGRKYYAYIFSPNISISESQNGFLHIPTGTDYKGLIKLLEQGDFLIKTDGFEWVAKQKKYGSNIKAGKYRLRNNMSNNDLVNLLRSGNQTAVKLTFNNIRTKEELAGVISKYIEADSTSLLYCFQDETILMDYGFNNPTCLGLFIPNTYEFWWNTSAEGFVKRMHQEYEKFWTKERKELAQKAKLTPQEVSALAAIVDEETIKADEKPMVAGLYINRLNKKVRLQADPTVKYALGDFSIQRVLKKDLEIDSPYNTYKYGGLPPGPIRIPSINGLEAVLNHSKHKYMYMCAKEDFSGYHNFALTLKQHNQNAAKFHKALQKRRIYR
ncbi:endolytic transglycosylase MltG [Carboxylicivirga sp. N1Y90]|uniref:endolytic transglycosylase MltG n=1 Tax=Carboxylicivirga fragile TaxID=3417571 RepID=UPI003D331B8B|nr:endolytic transglycosylase MltG [Marinilabiliaceae bacterium N1Y90]